MKRLGETSAASSGAPIESLANPELQAQHRKKQLRLRVLRTLRLAASLVKSDVAASNIQRPIVDFAKLARIAVELKKASDALKQSELLSDLGETQRTLSEPCADTADIACTVVPMRQSSALLRCASVGSPSDRALL